LYPTKKAYQKKGHKKQYEEERPGRFVFEKTSFPILLTLGLGLITPYT